MRDQNLRTALNLHPATGIYPHEKQYQKIAKRLGYNPEEFTPILFEISNQDFTHYYFQDIIHPYEEDGVDFWWMDWQQGDTTKIPNLDPLWWLNHLHFIDKLNHSETRPMIFSRWGGLGNHRYPIGFSGDTYISWDSLAFQPYFTATAANVGYCWWSHDIGGHMGGEEDAELFVRWIQFGCFSPILRLHSTKNQFIEKLPWEFDKETAHILTYYLQMRHRLIPYLYTMNWKTHKEGKLIIRPMYHIHPQQENSYGYSDQYYFGTELLVAPIVSPQNTQVGLSRKVIWLPKGKWFNFFTGEYFKGNQEYVLYQDLSEIPVFAKAGAIIPLQDVMEDNSASNPRRLAIVVFPGKSSSFGLYEDDGISLDYQNGTYAETPITLHSTRKEATLEIGPVKGDPSHIPKHREINVYFRGVNSEVSVTLTKNGSQLEISHQFNPEKHEISLSRISFAPQDMIKIQMTPKTKYIINQHYDCENNFNRLLRAMKIPHKLKKNLGLHKRLIFKHFDKFQNILDMFNQFADYVDYPIDLHMAASIILKAYMIQSMEPELTTPEDLQDAITNLPQTGFASLQPVLWDLYNNSQQLIELQQMDPEQIQALIEIMGRIPLRFE